MAEETTPTKPSPQAEAGTAKPAQEKKAKEPTLEEKPFNEFIEQHFMPALKEALVGKGAEDIELTFVKDKLAVAGVTSAEKFWQVKGNWLQGQRQFNLYFLAENINGQKVFSCAPNGAQPSTLESFMIDERKVTLDLMVLYTWQRLNGQKWLARN